MKPSLCRARSSAVRDERIVSTGACRNAYTHIFYSALAGEQRRRKRRRREECKHFTEIRVDQFSQTVLANKHRRAR